MSAQASAKPPKFLNLQVSAAPLGGEVVGWLNVDLSVRGPLIVRTDERRATGSLLPVRVTFPEREETVSAMCTVAGAVASREKPGEQSGLKLDLPEDDKVWNRMRDWIGPLAPVAVSAMVTPGSALNSDELVRKADELVEQGKVFEAEREFQKAYQVYCEAIAVYPVRAVELHLHLGRLAISRLGDPKLAASHAQKAAALAPGSPAPAVLLREIKQRRTAEFEAVKNNSKRAIRAGDRKRTLTIVSSGLAVLALVLGWISWAYLAPRGPSPLEVEMSKLSSVPSVQSALISRGSLVVTVDSAFEKLSPKDKREALDELRAVARLDFSVRRVVLTNASKIVLATVDGGKVQWVR